MLSFFQRKERNAYEERARRGGGRGRKRSGESQYSEETGYVYRWEDCLLSLLIVCTYKSHIVSQRQKIFESPTVPTI